MEHDLKSQQFVAVFSAVDADRNYFSSTGQLLGTVGENRIAVGVVAGVAVVFVLLCLRPPFVLKFKVDRRRPWRAETEFSWLSVFAIALLVTACVVAVPWLGRRAAAVWTAAGKGGAAASPIGPAAAAATPAATKTVP
jgi:hypothetical protein